MIEIKASTTIIDEVLNVNIPAFPFFINTPSLVCPINDAKIRLISCFKYIFIQEISQINCEIL